jgi:ribosomal protein L12E/L44/L45/RPP1/RPP2
VYNALTRNNLLNPDNAWLLDEISASVTAYDAATPEPLSPAPRAAPESSAEQEQKVEQKAEQERNNRPDW